MAATRSKRYNAGNRMSRLLNDEEEDEFYKSTYGGFNETTDDKDFLVSKNEDDDDIVDSDFSIDENDEPEEAPSDDEGKKKRTRKVVTRAYKEPPKASKKPVEKKPKEKKTPKPKAKAKFTVLDSHSLTGRKSSRKSTAAKTAAMAQRLKQRAIEERNRPKVVKQEEYIPTQEELLEEAKYTEKENLKSLERFRRMELEKKKVRPTKNAPTEPMIRYHSTTMPLIEEVTNLRNVKIEIEHPDSGRPEDVRRSERKKQQRISRHVNSRCERTFVIFLNDIDNKVCDSIFKPMQPKRMPRSRLCAVTGMPAVYFDPVTSLPYRNAQAFRVIREAYYQLLEEKGNTENPQVSKWLEWRRRVKELRAKMPPKNNFTSALVG